MPLDVHWTSKLLPALNGLNPPFIETLIHHVDRLHFNLIIFLECSLLLDKQEILKMLDLGWHRRFSEKQTLECEVGVANLSRSVQEGSQVICHLATNSWKESYMAEAAFVASCVL